jgi:hypothetical protein
VARRWKYDKTTSSTETREAASSPGSGWVQGSYLRGEEYNAGSKEYCISYKASGIPGGAHTVAKQVPSGARVTSDERIKNRYWHYHSSTTSQQTGYLDVREASGLCNANGQWFNCDTYHEFDAWPPNSMLPNDKIGAFGPNYDYCKYSVWWFQDEIFRVSWVYDRNIYQWSKTTSSTQYDLIASSNPSGQPGVSNVREEVQYMG